jgi:HEAT repeat protein
VKKRLVILLLTIIAVALVFVCLPSDEPKYGGKSLHIWLRKYSYSATFLEQRDAQAERAIGAIGTNAIPTLLQMLQSEESALKWKLIRLWNDQDFFKHRPYHSWSQQDIALDGFKALGPIAKPAIPNLAKMIDGTNAADYAVQALAAIGPDALETLIRASTNNNAVIRGVVACRFEKLSAQARDVIPVLLALAKDNNMLVRTFAVQTLGLIHQESGAAVPALIGCLEDSESPVRERAADALGKFGAFAKDALPTLADKAQNDESETVRTTAKTASETILLCIEAQQKSK